MLLAADHAASERRASAGPAHFEACECILCFWTTA